MISSNTIQVYEYGELRIGTDYGVKKKLEFKDSHYHALAKFLTENKTCQFFTLYHKRVRFCNYVGVIKVGDLTIEVLPKCDRYNSETKKSTWQKVLLEMLAISLQVEAKTTTHADIKIRKHSVLDTYLNIFLNETAILLHHGLVKKYRSDASNQTALKGKLLIHKHITKNIVHAERFYVSHQVYDRDNIYNSIIYQALVCILSINASISINKRCQSLLLDFPECRKVMINEKFFSLLKYDRKTERYKTAINLAIIILMNYHPDIKGGTDNILAIMFDMNLLWENYIYYVIRREGDNEISVRRQMKRLFWHHEYVRNIRLQPDIVIQKDKKKSIVLDTKWKYLSQTSSEDVRQMYAYGKYFNAKQNFLLYPDKVENEKVRIEKGKFYKPATNQYEEDISCGLMYVDLLKNNGLNKEIGKEILNVCNNNEINI